MILVIGASGALGGRVARRLLAAGVQVRAMSRTPEKLSELKEAGAEVVEGDLRDRESLARACRGVEKVFTTAAAFDGKGSNSMRQVDVLGNRNLVDAAREAGVRRLVFTSAVVARPDTGVDFFRAKYETEEYLRASGLSYTILRPAAFMEVWAASVGGAIASGGPATILGSGQAPINFVAIDDVAEIAARALLDEEGAADRTLAIGGPENLTMEEVAQTYERVLGRTARRKRVPVGAMRLIGAVTRPFAPVLARMMAAGVALNTEDQTVDPGEVLELYPLQLTRLEDWVRATSGASAAPETAAH